jgi:hypothetical protein
MKEMIKLDFKLNEKYHDTKEKVIWIAFGLYLTYSASIIKFVVEKKDLLLGYDIYFLIFILDIIISIFSFLFIVLQVSRKYMSVLKSQKIRYIISRNNDQDIINWFACSQFEIEKELGENNRKNIFLSNIIEIVLLMILCTIFIGKLVLFGALGLYITRNTMSYIVIALSFIYFVIVFIFIKISEKNT